MHWTLILTSIALIWCGMGGLWNRGSLALVASWAIAQVWWLQTGINVPVNLYIAADLTVIGAFVWRRVLSPLDWIVVGLFPAEWYFYRQPDVLQTWWALWGLSLAQMILAGPWPAFQRINGPVSHGPLRRITV
jgi:hypothetical protein